MTEPEIDYTALFRALPGSVALLTPQLVYADANEEFLRLAGRTREQVVGHYLPDDASGDPDDPLAAVIRNIEASLRRVADTGQPDTMPLQRYEAEDPDRPGVRDEHYVSLTSAPVFGSDGRVALLPRTPPSPTRSSTGTPTPPPATAPATPRRRCCSPAAPSSS